MLKVNSNRNLEQFQCSYDVDIVMGIGKNRQRKNNKLTKR